MRVLNIDAFVQLPSNEVGIIQQIENTAFELEVFGSLLDMPIQEVFNHVPILAGPLDILAQTKMCPRD